MTRQTFLGWLFLFVGLLLIGVSLVPVVVGLRSHPPTHGDVVIAVLLIGIGLALLGAWMLPNSGAPAAVTGFVTVIGPLVPSLRFGRTPTAAPSAPLTAPLTAPPTAPPADGPSNEP